MLDGSITGYITFNKWSTSFERVCKREQRTWDHNPAGPAFVMTMCLDQYLSLSVSVRCVCVPCATAPTILSSVTSKRDSLSISTLRRCSGSPTATPASQSTTRKWSVGRWAWSRSTPGYLTAQGSSSTLTPSLESGRGPSLFSVQVSAFINISIDLAYSPCIYLGGKTTTIQNIYY